MRDDSIIDNDDQDFPFDPLAIARTEAAAEAKQEALHKVVLALYAAKSKGMNVCAIIHALRDFKAESTDDIGLAISEFNPAEWGYLG